MRERGILLPPSQNEVMFLCTEHSDADVDETITAIAASFTALQSRGLLEVTDACIEVWGADRVGMHLAPRADSHDMGDSDRAGTFGYVARELGKRGIAFIAARERAGEDAIGPLLKKEFGGVYIANEQFTQESAQAALDRGDADAVAWGKLFIANADLVKRFQTGADLNSPNAETFYARGAEGYTDYPTLETTD